MHEAAISPFAAWESFYVIIGSSAAVLTGLQFVAIVLIADLRKRSTTGEIDAFVTPTIVHFGAVLLVSAILSAPWRALTSAGLSLGMTGAVAVSYSALVMRRLNRQTEYRLVAEDWLWHAVFPIIAYAALVAGAIELGRHSHASLFAIAAAALLLLFVGIHNAWDIMTYFTVHRPQVPRDHS